MDGGGVEKNLYILLNYLEKKVNKIILITYDSTMEESLKKILKLLILLRNFFNFKKEIFNIFYV